MSKFSNRAFKYGDGLFETIRVRDGKINLLEQHYHRLSKGLDLLQLQEGKNRLSLEGFAQLLNNFLEQEIGYPALHHANLRVRMTFFRQGVGLYTPQETSYHCHIEATLLQESNFQLNPIGLNLGICTKVRLAIDQLSNLKTISALPYVVAALEKKEKGWDDCLLLNSKEAIAESIAANVFVVKNKQLYTPALTEGCVEGVMRWKVIQLAQQLGFSIVETSIPVDFLQDAEEFFLTNAIQGITWVERVEGIKGYKNDLSSGLLELLLK